MKIDEIDTARLSLSEKLTRGDLLATGCPSREVLKHVTSRWGVLILMSLEQDTLRFSALRQIQTAAGPTGRSGIGLTPAQQKALEIAAQIQSFEDKENEMKSQREHAQQEMLALQARQREQGRQGGAWSRLDGSTY